MTYQTIACLMLSVLVVSLLYPWDFRWPGAKVLVHLPLLLLPLWWRYEQVMSSLGMNIRVDLLWIIPGLLLAAVVYAGKLAFLFTQENWRLKALKTIPSPQTVR